jgi:hypothetical protein
MLTLMAVPGKNYTKSLYLCQNIITLMGVPGKNYTKSLY